MTNINKVLMSLNSGRLEVACSPSLQRSRIHGCWLGKSIGGTLGLPAEGKIGRLHFSYYDPVPTVAPPNDDLELQLVWLDMIEKGGSSLALADFATAWINRIHYMWDEYGRCRWNLRRGVPLESVGTFENPFHAGMGSPIRSEIWACLFAGDTDSAAYYAAMDSTLDHGLEGIAGEVFFAVLQSLVAVGTEFVPALWRAKGYLPKSSDTARAVELVLNQYQQSVPVWDCWQEIIAHFGSENFTHTPLNIALTVRALLYGEGDFEASILLAVNGGYDTDCTAATVGATLGLMFGLETIPERWSEPIGEEVFVGPGILGIDLPRTLKELTDRTIALIGKLDSQKWDSAIWTRTPSPVLIDRLPGTTKIHTPSRAISWANGELPPEIKEARGGTWDWMLTSDEPRKILCLARDGARLFVDDRLVVECPPGLPYVPAPHRCATQAIADIQLSKGSHRVRVELASDSEDQDACVLLAYPNFHLSPWTFEELPDRANLPAPL